MRLDHCGSTVPKILDEDTVRVEPHQQPADHDSYGPLIMWGSVVFHETPKMEESGNVSTGRKRKKTELLEVEEFRPLPKPRKRSRVRKREPSKDVSLDKGKFTTIIVKISLPLHPQRL